MLFLRILAKLRLVKSFLDKFQPVDNYLKQSETNTVKLRSMGCAQTRFQAFGDTNQGSMVQIRAVRIHNKRGQKSRSGYLFGVDLELCHAFPIRRPTDRTRWGGDIPVDKLVGHPHGVTEIQKDINSFQRLRAKRKLVRKAKEQGFLRKSGGKTYICGYLNNNRFLYPYMSIPPFFRCEHIPS